MDMTLDAVAFFAEHAARHLVHGVRADAWSTAGAVFNDASPHAMPIDEYARKTIAQARRAGAAGARRILESLAAYRIVDAVLDGVVCDVTEAERAVLVRARAEQRRQRSAKGTAACEAPRRGLGRARARGPRPLHHRERALGERPGRAALDARGQPRRPRCAPRRSAACDAVHPRRRRARPVLPVAARVQHARAHRRVPPRADRARGHRAPSAASRGASMRDRPSAARWSSSARCAASGRSPRAPRASMMRSCASPGAGARDANRLHALLLARHRHRARGALRPRRGLSRVARGPRGGGAGRADAPRRRAAARARRGAARARGHRRPRARRPARCGRARHADPGRDRHRQDRGAACAGDGAGRTSAAPGRARAACGALHVHQPPCPPNPRRRRAAHRPGARSARASGDHGRCARGARPVHRPRPRRARNRAARVPDIETPTGARSKRSPHSRPSPRPRTTGCSCPPGSPPTRSA